MGKEDKIHDVINVCPNHTKPEEIMPLVYNRDTGDSICITCGERYRLLEGVQVMWSKELQDRAIEAAKKFARGGEVEVQKVVEKAECEYPSKNFEQLLHDFIVEWKENNPNADESSRIKASVVLCRLYLEKVSSKWTIEQMKEYFDVDTITIY